MFRSKYSQFNETFMVILTLTEVTGYTNEEDYVTLINNNPIYSPHVHLYC